MGVDSEHREMMKLNELKKMGHDQCEIGAKGTQNLSSFLRIS